MSPAAVYKGAQWDTH